MYTAKFFYEFCYSTLTTGTSISGLGKICPQFGFTFPPVTESLTQYVGVVLAGMAGSSHLVSASIISLSKLLFEFKGLSLSLSLSLLSTTASLHLQMW